MSYLSELYVEMTELNNLISHIQIHIDNSDSEERTKVLRQQYNIWMFKLYLVQEKIYEYTRITF